MDKISAAQAGQIIKVAAENLRLLSAANQELAEQNRDLLTKVASYEHQARAVRIAQEMQDKGLEPDTSIEEKVANLVQRNNLDVLEEAVRLNAPQTKIASVVDGLVQSDGGPGVDGEAESRFAANLASF